MRHRRTIVCDIIASTYAREPVLSDRERALEWLEVHAAGTAPVFLPSEIPDDVLQALRRLDLVVPVPGGLSVVRSPGDDPVEVLRALVWPIVEALTRRYEPAVVERDSAVRLYLGRTDPGPEIRIRQTGGTRWREEIAPGVAVRVERGDVVRSRAVKIGEAEIPVDAPETILLMLPLNFLRDHLGEVALWLRSLVILRPSLTEAYRERPRPVVLKRIEHIARDVGNERLADFLGRVISEEQSVRIGRDRTGVGQALVVPPLVAHAETTRQPWLDRLRVAIRDSGEQVGAILETLDGTTPPHDLDALLSGAREARAYDAYHSSSIEGYRLSLDEVTLLLGGGAPRGAGRRGRPVPTRDPRLWHGLRRSARPRGGGRCSRPPHRRARARSVRGPLHAVGRSGDRGGRGSEGMAFGAGLHPGRALRSAESREGPADDRHALRRAGCHREVERTSSRNPGASVVRLDPPPFPTAMGAWPASS